MVSQTSVHNPFLEEGMLILVRGLIQGILYVDCAEAESSITQYDIYGRNATCHRGMLFGQSLQLASLSPHAQEQHAH